MPLEAGSEEPLKPEYARFGSFDVLRDSSEVRLNRLFGEMTEMTVEAGSSDEKIVILYKQGLDSAKLNAEGNAPSGKCWTRSMRWLIDKVWRGDRIPS